MSNSTKGILLACLTALMWGVLAIALKVALNYIDSYTIVWWRFAASFVMLVIYFAFSRPQALLILKRPPILLLLGGFLLGFNFLGFQQGVEFAGPAVSQVIIQAGPVALALTGFLFFKEAINPVRIAGFILAVIGFYFFYRQQMQLDQYDMFSLRKGILWTFFGAAAWTGFAIINKVLVKRISSIQINLIIYGVPSLLYIPLVDFQSLFMAHSFWIWLLFLFLALNTVLAYGALSLALKYIEANRISFIVAMNPIITFIILELMLALNIYWFDSPPMVPAAYIGAIMVLVGVALAVGVTKIKRFRFKRGS